MKQILLSILVLGSSVAINAQVHTINNYHYGTRITYYVGECGNDIPEAEGKIHFCDVAGNQGVVENSFGLSGRNVFRMEANFYNDDRIFVTGVGLSINKEDGTWDNIPNRSVPTWGDPGQSTTFIQEAIYLPNGKIVFHGGNIGQQIDQYDPVTKEFSATLLNPTVNSQHPNAMDYDADRDLVWILAGSNTNKKLYTLQDGVSTFAHDLDVFSFTSSHRSDRWAYANDALWMISANSLVKIDLLNDYAETVYDYTSTGLLPFEVINDIEFDSEGMLWLAQSGTSTSDGGLTRFDPETEAYSVYQIEDESPGGYDVRFNRLGIDSEGHVWGVSNDYAGLYELDVTGTDTLWTLYANEDFDALGLPFTYNPVSILTQNGKTYFTTTSVSSSFSDDFEILVREGDTWSGINDNEEGNFSLRMAASSYAKTLSDPEGGLWNFGQSNGTILYLNDETDFHYEHSTGFGQSQMCSINATGDLTVQLDNEVGSYENGVFTPYESIAGVGFYSTASVGNSVWAWDASNNLVHYVGGLIMDTYDLPALSGHYNMAPLTNGNLIFVNGWGGELSIQRFDPLTEVVTLEYTWPSNGTLREVIAGENGTFWIIEGQQLLYFDGTGADPLVLDTDNTDMSISVSSNYWLQDAVLDTDMNLHVIMGGGTIYTLSPPYDDMQVETLQFSGSTGIMPYQDGLQQGYNRIGLDADGDLWFSKGGYVYELKDDNDAAEFHVDVVVGVEDFGPSTSLWGLRLYPNPGTNYIEFDATEQLDNVKVSDLLGQVVSTHSLLNSSRIDVGELPPGIYLLELVSRDGFAQTVKWVKK